MSFIQIRIVETPHFVIAEKHSKREVSRAGYVMVSPNSTDEERADAKSIINYWRSIHKAPLLSALNEISSQAEVVGGALVVGRVKKFGTIIDKLQRPDTPKDLKTMYDIAGCRAVVEDMGQLGVLSHRLEKLSSCDWEKSSKRDYIASPKESGYRSKHLIHSYQLDEYGYGLWVELQVRTALQHAWATAVEMYDLIDPNSRLKANKIGTPAGRFFQLASKIIEADEMGNGSFDRSRHVEELKAIDSSEGILQNLKAGSESSFVIEVGSSSVDADFFLVDFVKDEQSIVLRKLKAEHAVDEYFAAESSDNEGAHDYVLVKGQSIDQIMRAYPNYFGDISLFVDCVHEMIG